jgi:HemY protein
MKLVLFGFALLGFAALSVWLSNFPGLVTFVWFGYTIELNPVLFLGILVFAFILFLAFYKFIAFFIHLPLRFKNYREDRRIQIGLKALTKALVSLASGDGREAMRHAQSAKNNLPNSPLADFFTAKAAQLEGNEDQARDCLHQLSNHSETSLLGIKGLISYAQKENNRSLITHLAQRAYRIKEDTPWVLSILLDHAILVKNWADAFKYAQKMTYYHFWSNEEGNRKRAFLFIAQALDLKKEGKFALALDDAQKACRLLPNALETHYILAELFVEMNEPKKARKIIAKIWNQHPHRDFGALYKQSLVGKTESEKIHFCEELIMPSPEHKASQTFMAQIYLEAKLWGKARQILERLIAKEPNKELYYLMAQLEESEYHHHDQANAWLRKAKDCDVSEQWICRSCQTIHATWIPICAHCQSFDQIYFTKSSLQPTLLLMQKGEIPFTLVDMPLHPNGDKVN